MVAENDFVNGITVILDELKISIVVGFALNMASLLIRLLLQRKSKIINYEHSQNGSKIPSYTSMLIVKCGNVFILQHVTLLHTFPHT